MSNNLSPATSVPTPRDGHEICEVVVEAIADAEGTSPAAVGPPLATVVDPDALDRLVASMARSSAGRTGAVTFPYAGYDVTVHGDGEVSVTAAGA